jgi:hypothetical protein
MLIDECLTLDTRQKCDFELRDSLGIFFPSLSFVTVYDH